MDLMPKRFMKWLSFNFRYFWDTPWDTGITPPEVVDLINSSKPGCALDLGAGTGTNIITLARAGWETIGVEYAFAAVIIARLKIKRAGVDAKIYFHDVTDLGFITTDFDLVLDIGCFHSLNPVEREQYRKNLYRLLRQGGTYVLYSFLSGKTGSQMGISEGEIKLFSQMLEELSVERGTEQELRDSIWLKYRKKQG
jgi:SAM-dependent methyltransferase